MRTPSVKQWIRVAAAAAALFLGTGVAFPAAAFAADEVSTEERLNADQLKRLAALPEAERNKIRDNLNQEHGKRACSNGAFWMTMGGNECENVSSKAFGTFLTTPEKALDYDGTKTPFCKGLSAVKAPAAGFAYCVSEAIWDKWAPVAGVAMRTALSMSPAGKGVLGVVDTVAFIANAKNGFEDFANTVKTEGVKAANEVLNNLLKVSEFQVNKSFTDTWAVFAGVGILVLALMYLKLWKDVADEEVDLDSARDALVWYGPLSMVLVLFGPMVGWQLNTWLAGIVDGITPWTSTRVVDFSVATARFASYESTGLFGPLAGVVLFGLMWLGAWALLGLFAVQPLAMYLLGTGIALAIGFLIHPKYRPGVLKTGTLWLSIALTKPLMLLVMGALFAFIVAQPAFTDGGVDDGLVNATSVFIAGAAMCVLGFSPALLFKFVPLLPSTATGLGADRPSVVGASSVAGASAALSTMIRQRRTSALQSDSSGSRASDRGAANSRNGNALALEGSGSSRNGGPGGHGRRSAEQSGPAQGGLEQAGSEQTIGGAQRAERASGGGARMGAAARSGAARVGRGSVKIAAGGATAFLLAGREAARQASIRGQRAAGSMAPDTDHISGR
jgi:hypothetical protein